MKFPHSLILALALCTPAAGFCDEAEELKASIIVRCLYQFGEFGSELVDICVKDDLAAAQALQNYPSQSAAIIDRCARSLLGDGWSRIRMCADGDIAAEEALAKLDPKHAPAIAECRARMHASGSAKVKACVDAALAGN